MTDQVIRLDAVVVNKTIGSTVKALAAGRGVGWQQLATALGISRAAYFYKVAGQHPFTAPEMAALASFFGVRIGDLFSGMDGTFGPTTPGSGAVALRARQESNLRPSDYLSDKSALCIVSLPWVA